MKWHYCDEKGNPPKGGIYWVTLIYPEIRDGKETGRTVAEVDTRCYADIDKNPDLRNWVMEGEPEHGLVWTEQTGSSEHERVWAWAELDGTPFPERLPEGVEKCQGYFDE